MNVKAEMRDVDKLFSLNGKHTPQKHITSYCELSDSRVDDNLCGDISVSAAVAATDYLAGLNVRLELLLRQKIRSLLHGTASLSD